ncbi:MAG: hypothetical protein JZU63_10810, partial [Rhodoferax sp.]|nr:hypothetical protein [Rhodoferax sp.]
MQDQVTPDDALATSYLPKWAAVTLGCVMVAGFWQFTAASLKFQEMALPSTWTDFRQGRTTGTLE